MTVHEIVVRASTGHTAPNPDPLVEWGVDGARVNWGPPDPGSRCYQHCTHWTEAGEECCDCKRIIPEHELFMPWCPGKQENA